MPGILFRLFSLANPAKSCGDRARYGFSGGDGEGIRYLIDSAELLEEFRERKDLKNNLDPIQESQESKERREGIRWPFRRRDWQTK